MGASVHSEVLQCGLPLAMALPWSNGLPLVQQHRPGQRQGAGLRGLADCLPLCGVGVDHAGEAAQAQPGHHRQRDGRAMLASALQADGDDGGVQHESPLLTAAEQAAQFTQLMFEYSTLVKICGFLIRTKGQDMLKIGPTQNVA